MSDVMKQVILERDDREEKVGKVKRRQGCDSGIQQKRTNGDRKTTWDEGDGRGRSGKKEVDGIEGRKLQEKGEDGKARMYWGERQLKVSRVGEIKGGRKHVTKERAIVNHATGYEGSGRRGKGQMNRWTWVKFKKTKDVAGRQSDYGKGEVSVVIIRMWHERSDGREVE